MRQPKEAPTNAEADGLYNKASLESASICACSFRWRFDKMPLRWGKSTLNITTPLQAYKKSEAGLVRLTRTILRQGSAIETGGPVPKKDGRNFEQPRVLWLGKISPIDSYCTDRHTISASAPADAATNYRSAEISRKNLNCVITATAWSRRLHLVQSCRPRASLRSSFPDCRVSASARWN